MAREKQYENDYKEFIELLNKHGVEYLIIGAYAVMFHTNIARETKDIDFWINRTKENAEKCARAIKEFAGLDVTSDDLLDKDQIFFIGVEPYRIDLFNEQNGFSFYDAYAKRKEGKFRNVKAIFISKKDLLAIKEHFYRKDDMKDIKRLNKAE